MTNTTRNKEPLHLLHQQAWMDEDKAIHYIPIKIVEPKNVVKEEKVKSSRKIEKEAVKELTVLERLEKLKTDHGIIVI